MTVRGYLTKLGDWLLRTDAMRAARAAAPQPGSDRARALAQSRLVMEVARRVAEPVETLPPGSRAPVLLGLYRDAAYWAVVAALPEGQSRPADLKGAWTASDPELLLRAAGDARALDAVSGVLLSDRSPGDLDETDDDAARARSFTDALLWQIAAPQRQVERVVGQRWSRLLLAGVVAIVLVLGRRPHLRRPPLPHQPGAQPVGRVRPRLPPEDPSRRRHQPERLLRRARGPARRRGERQPNQLDRGRAPGHHVFDLDRQVSADRGALREAHGP